MDHPDFRADGKIFATLGYPDEKFAMVKLTPGQQAELVKKQPAVFTPVPGKWGLRGATHVHLRAAESKSVKKALEMARENLKAKKKALSDDFSARRRWRCLNVQEQGTVTTRQPQAHTQLGRAAAQVFAVNDRINQILIARLDPKAWKAKAPAKTRTIAAIFTHMHNVRTKWIRLSAPHLKVPPQLNRTQCTPQQARKGLAESTARCQEMLAEALDGGRIQKFVRDGWAKPWPAGPEMLCYMISHEAHHRGQVCMLAHQLGFPLPNEVGYGIWNWEKLWRDCGSPAGPGSSETKQGKARLDG
jgi:uncharacterized damage-inducible protein DinB